MGDELGAGAVDIANFFMLGVTFHSINLSHVFIRNKVDTVKLQTNLKQKKMEELVFPLRNIIETPFCVIVCLATLLAKNKPCITVAQ